MTDQIIRYWDLMETIRNNQVAAAERERSNRANEAIAQQQVALGYANLAETQRANRERESYNRAALEQSLTVVDLNNTNRLQTTALSSGAGFVGGALAATIKNKKDNNNNNNGGNNRNGPGGFSITGPSVTRTTAETRNSGGAGIIQRISDYMPDADEVRAELNQHHGLGQIPIIPTAFLETLGGVATMFG